jgi:formamidopyrimidine-DNA glycosylase
MPELPEVETVKNGLSELLSVGARVEKITPPREKLRFPFPKAAARKLKGASIQSVRRRAKYLIFEFEQGLLLNHLGMTGSWRISEGPQKHDHVCISLQDGRKLIYNDPRRFGYFDFIPSEGEASCRWFHHLGWEPLSREFRAVELHRSLKKKSAPIKTAIMDQKLVVGVGNIYASEALFLAGIPPHRPSNQLTPDEVKDLVSAIKKVLKKAIRAGGTTIRDFKQAGGSSGYFQQKLNVYGRQGEPCRACATPISLVTMAGRSTYWCKTCQKD